MFCGNCGTNNEDNATFCNGCGASLTEGGAENNNVAPEKVNNNIVKYGVIAAVAVVAVVLLVVIFGGNSPKSVVKNTLDATYKGKVNKLKKVYSKKMVENFIEEYEYDEYDDYDEFVDELIDEAEEDYENLQERWGDNFKVSYKIKKVKDVKKSELEDIQDLYDEIDIEVKDAKEVKVDIELKKYDEDAWEDFCDEHNMEDDEPEDEWDIEYIVVKIGGSWYLSDF